MFCKFHPILRFLLSFLIGALTLVLLSFIQKTIAGFDPFKPMAYLIPFVFGGVVGIIIGRYIFKVKDLNEQLEQRVDSLEQILPICSNCKKIRKPDTNPDEQGSWEIIESYIRNNTSSSFSHGICPECMHELYGEYIDRKKCDHK